VTLQEAAWGAADPNVDRNAGTAAAGTPLWVVLDWQVGAAQPGLRSAVDLSDPAGHRLASAEAPLLDLRAHAQGVRPGDTVRTYHLLTIPATQAPGPLVLSARLYHSQTKAPVLLAEPVVDGAEGGLTRLAFPFARPAATQAQQVLGPNFSRPYDQPFGTGIVLLGADDWPATVHPGEKFTVRLYWQVNESAAAQPLEMTVAPPGSAGSSARRTRFQIPGDLSVPAVIHTDVDLALAADSGLGRHVIALRDEAGSELELGTVEVAGWRRTREAQGNIRDIRATFGSAIELIGVTSPSVVNAAPGQTLTVPLVWKALQPPEDEIARFLHILGPDGRLVAQRSGAPCAGRDEALPDDACPSTSWLPNETLIDSVQVTLPSDLPPGRYNLATGWYDPATLERLAARDAEGNHAPDDLFDLPVELVVK
jgi:hypothetical protein